MPVAWYALKNPEECYSPALLVYPGRIRRNIQFMLEIAGGAERLRPHIKTHKMAEIIRLQMDAGIRKFKCATIAEAELLGRCKAPDVLLAMQPIGPNQERLLRVQEQFPATTFSTLVDDRLIARQLSDLARARNKALGIYLDLNVGMDRTGISPGDAARELYRELHALPGLESRGFHAYDGHIRHTDPTERDRLCAEAIAPVLSLRDKLRKEGIAVPSIVAGGSPSFPVHAQNPELETSPGTTLLWDAGYAGTFPEMPFLPAAVLHSRVISKPRKGILCLDLGHKAVASEMPFPRVELLNMENCLQRSQSEEHLVLTCPEEDSYSLGYNCYALPVHICPTVAKYPKVLTIEDGLITGSWEVAARDHRLWI